MHFFKNDIFKNTTHSCLKDSYLYFIENNKVYRSSLHSKSKVEFIQEIDTLNLKSIDFIDKKMIFIYQNRILWGNQTHNIMIKKYFIDNSTILVLNSKNQLVVLSKDKTYILVEHINTFTIDSFNIWLVDKNNNIFKQKYYESLPSISLSNPIKALKIKKDKDIENIEVNKNLFLCYENSIEVYEINKNLLVLKYTYNTKEYKIYNCNKLYVVDQDTLILENYPNLILNGITNSIYKDKESDVLINNKNIIYNTIINKANTVKLGTSNCRVEHNIENLKTTFIIDSINEKYIFNKFEEEVINKYRRFYYELVTTNDSLILKKEKLKELYIKVNDKIRRQEERKNNIKNKIKEISNKYDNIISTVKIDGKNIFKLIDIFKRELEMNVKLYDEKSYKILKIQNDLLTKKVYKQY